MPRHVGTVSVYYVLLAVLPLHAFAFLARKNARPPTPFYTILRGADPPMRRERVTMAHNGIYPHSCRRGYIGQGHRGRSSYWTTI